MSRRKWIGLLVAGAVVAAVVWYVLPSRALRGYEAAVGTCVPWDGSKDHTYSTGQGILETEGDRSVTITSVELLDPSEAESSSERG